jgi:hypothetical protein
LDSTTAPIIERRLADTMATHGGSDDGLTGATLIAMGIASAR